MLRNNKSHLLVSTILALAGLFSLSQSIAAENPACKSQLRGKSICFWAKQYAEVVAKQVPMKTDNVTTIVSAVSVDNRIGFHLVLDASETELSDKLKEATPADIARFKTILLEQATNGLCTMNKDTKAFIQGGGEASYTVTDNRFKALFTYIVNKCPA
ncbi:hypothetical protein LG202_13600 [Methylobacillus methanolivorans]